MVPELEKKIINLHFKKKANLHFIMGFFTNAVEKDAAKTCFLLWGIVAVLVVLVHLVWWMRYKEQFAGYNFAFWATGFTAVYVILSAIWWFALYGDSTVAETTTA